MGRVAQPARAQALVAATRAASKVCGAAAGTRVGRETRPRGHPALLVPGRSDTAFPAQGPTFPGLSCIFLWGLRSVLSAQSRELWESQCERMRRFRFRNRLPSLS